MSKYTLLSFRSFATILSQAVVLTVFAQTKPFDFQRFVLDDCVYREYLASFDSLIETGSTTYDYKSNECNLDNQIFLPGQEFIYDYYYRRDGQSYKFDFSNRETGLASCDYRLDNTVFSFSYKIMSGQFMGQTRAWYGYYGPRDTIQNFEISGIIENKMNLWLHPPRSEMFQMLEIAPFPFIRFPLEVGTTWTDSLGIGDHYSDHRWAKWEGSIVNQTQRKITGKDIVSTAFGKLLCYVVKSWSTNSLGTTSLASYFNEQYGFVRLEYGNIDGSELIANLVKVKVAP
ncbi:MAG: hypothetical protein IT258_02375 [Saprospiraceae bacterium]|nr:hypothetical protein [Saprospiraceae bacterium]